MFIEGDLPNREPYKRGFTRRLKKRKHIRTFVYQAPLYWSMFQPSLFLNFPIKIILWHVCIHVFCLYIDPNLNRYIIFILALGQLIYIRNKWFVNFTYKVASTPRIPGAAYLELDVKYSNTINIEIFGRFPEFAFTKPLPHVQFI